MTVNEFGNMWRNCKNSWLEEVKCGRCQNNYFGGVIKTLLREIVVRILTGYLRAGGSAGAAAGIPTGNSTSALSGL